MEDERKSSCDDICERLRHAFSARELFTVSEDNFDDILKHTFSYGEEFTFSCFPGLLCISLQKHNRSRLHDVIGYLNCEFYPDEPYYPIDIRNYKKQIFDTLNDQERAAVAEWLEFTKALIKEDEFYLQEVSLALGYWKRPPRTNTAEQCAPATTPGNRLS